MEPVTHFLTGACIGRAGLNRKTAYATLAGLLAAEAADLDIFWGFAGPVEELKHHRGITHTLWAVPVVAGVIVGAVWLLDRARRQRFDVALSSPISAPEALKEHGFGRAERVRANHWALAPEGTKQNTPTPSAPQSLGPSVPAVVQPIHFGWLYLTAFIAALSHILLDWTNNYGVRPLFPLNPRWYAGSFMFIAEPIIWLLLFLALFMPWVLGLADHEIGARRKAFRGRGWAIFALVGIFLLGCWRWTEHARSLSILQNTGVATEPVIRMAAEPYPVDPFRWHTVLETGSFYQIAEINTRTGAISSDPRSSVLYKPTDTPAVEAAKRTRLGRVYLDWGTWPVIRDVGKEPIAALDPPNLPPGHNWTTVEFTDLRFDYSFLASRNSPGRSPLSGWVYLVSNGADPDSPADVSSSTLWQEAGEGMGGRVQR